MISIQWGGTAPSNWNQVPSISTSTFTSNWRLFYAPRTKRLEDGRIWVKRGKVWHLEGP